MPHGAVVRYGRTIQVLAGWGTTHAGLKGELFASYYFAIITKSAHMAAGSTSATAVLLTIGDTTYGHYFSNEIKGHLANQTKK